MMMLESVGELALLWHFRWHLMNRKHVPIFLYANLIGFVVTFFRRNLTADPSVLKWQRARLQIDSITDKHRHKNFRGIVIKRTAGLLKLLRKIYAFFDCSWLLRPVIIFKSKTSSLILVDDVLFIKHEIEKHENSNDIYQIQINAQSAQITQSLHYCNRFQHEKFWT